MGSPSSLPPFWPLLMNVDAKSDALGQRSNSIIKLFAIGWALFAAASIGVREIGERFFPDVLAAHPGLSNFLLKSLLIIVAFFMATRGVGWLCMAFDALRPTFAGSLWRCLVLFPAR